MAFSGTNILDIHHDSFERKLTIHFLGGGKYEYYNVPQEVYQDILLSKNKSKVFNEKIKDVYKYKKIY